MNSKPKLLIVGNFLSASSGATRGVCQELADRMGARGYRVLRTSARTNKLARLSDMLSTAWNHRHEYDVAQVDVFSGTAFIWAEAVCAVMRKAGRPYILTLHGGNLPVFAQKHPGRVRRLLQSAMTVTAPSHYLRRAFEDIRGDIELLPNAIDLASYPFRYRDRLRPRLMWMRAFHDVYNPLLAIRALEQLVPEYPEIQLRMAGPDKGDGTFAAAQVLAVSLGVARNVRFEGPIPKPDVPDWLAQGDIFLNTPRVDNTPVTILEVMACGLCTVSTDVGGIADLVHDHSTALLAPNDDANGVADAVRELLGDRVLSGRLSSRGRRQVESLDWSVVLDRWEVLFRNAADGNPETLNSSAQSALV